VCFQKNQTHQQKERQKITKNLGDANQKYQEVSDEKINQKGPTLVAMALYLADEYPATKSVFEIGDKVKDKLY
jgi:hypothetical protein